MPERLQMRTWVAVIALAMITRIAWALVIPVIPTSDSHAYDTFARNIAAGDGFCWKPGDPTAFWAVGTPAVYAALYSVFGVSYTPIVVLNIVLGVATVFLTMWLTHHWFGELPATFAGLLLAVWPSQVQFTTVLASELLFNVFVLAGLSVWISGTSASLTRSFILGIVWAVASYLRPIALLIPLILAVIRACSTGFSRTQLRFAFTEAAIAVTVMVACILPWTVRNHHVFGHFVLISTNSGSNFWMGNNPQNPAGTYTVRPVDLPAGEVEGDRLLKQRAIEYIRDEPAAFVVRTLRKLIFLHSSETIGVHWNRKGLEQKFGQSVLTPMKAASAAYWLLMLLLALVGVGVLWRRQGWWNVVLHPAVVLWGYFAAVHAVIVIGDRYHFPSIPFIAALAGLAVDAVLSGKFRYGRVSSTAP